MKNIVLPLPPTDNRLRRPIVRKGNPSLIKTSEYTQWCKDAAIDWKIWVNSNGWEGLYEPSESNQLIFSYQLFLPSRRSDIGNYTKAIADFLGGNKKNKRLFKDDHWIILHLSRRVEIVSENDARVEIDPYPALLQ